MGIELKIQQMTMDGLPYTCPECDTSAFTLDARGMVDAFASVWATCSSYHSWEVMILDIDDLRAIDVARTGRQRAEDEDTFAIIIGGALLEGTLHPDVIVDDLKRAARDVYWKKIIKPGLRRQKNRAKQAVKRPLRQAAAAITGTASNTAAAAKAAAIGADWNLRTGGTDPNPDYTPEPINPCPVCDGGHIQLDTHLHATTTVRCTVCSGTGEID